MSFGEAVRSVYANYSRFEGRAPRSEYWWFQLFNVLVIIGVSAVGAILAMTVPRNVAFTLVGIGLLVFVVLNFIPSLSVTARRLHDSDKSAWWMLISLVPYLGAIVLLVFMVLPGTPGHNRFGPPHGQPLGDQRAQYWGPARSEALRKFAADAQQAAAAGYEPVWQEWKRYGGGEVLEVVYGRRPPDVPMSAPTAPWQGPPNPG